jgi:hypothetical protein
MAVVCFKVAKHFASASGAYFEYMLNLPETMKATVVDATILLSNDPDTGESEYMEKKGMTPNEYRAWLTKFVKPFDKMPQKLKNDFLRHHLHLL